MSPDLAIGLAASENVQGVLALTGLRNAESRNQAHWRLIHQPDAKLLIYFEMHNYQGAWIRMRPEQCMTLSTETDCIGNQTIKRLYGWLDDLNVGQRFDSNYIHLHKGDLATR